MTWAARWPHHVRLCVQSSTDSTMILVRLVLLLCALLCPTTRLACICAACSAVCNTVHCLISLHIKLATAYRIHMAWLTLAGDLRMVTMTGSSGLRWAALAALAALAAADFLAQYVVAATPLASVLHLPPATVDFLNVGSTDSCAYMMFVVVQLYVMLCHTLSAPFLLCRRLISWLPRLSEL